MVKFSKELEAQLIPEWKEAFVNYWQLKKQIKKIKVSRIPKQTPPETDIGEFGRSIFDSIRFVANQLVLSGNKLFGSSDSNKPELVQVRNFTNTTRFFFSFFFYICICVFPSIRLSFRVFLVF